jgi:predicted alpha/beta-hydrolase family hydrolase
VNRTSGITGHCILSHGFESGPDATKVTALAAAAERLGWTHQRPDYTAFDARRHMSELGDVEARQAHLLTLALAAAARGPLVLAGSSLGAYISARVSLEVPVAGLFLMAPPTRMGRLEGLNAAAVPTSVIHGWDDELIPAQQVVHWAHPRRARLLMVNDSHRLTLHVEASAEAFTHLLQSIK